MPAIQSTQTYTTAVPNIVTSGTTAFLMSMDQIIRKAMSKLGVQNPNTVEYNNAILELNLIMNDLQNKGTLLWKQQDALVPLISGYPAYYLDPLMVDTLHWFFRYEGDDTGITPFTRENYMQQSTKLEGGEPNMVFVDWQLQQPVAKFYPVYQNTTGFVVGTDGKSYICTASHTSADANRPITGADWSDYWELCTIATAPAGNIWVLGTDYDSGCVYFTKVVRSQDILSTTDNPDAPVRWDNALVWMLADALAPEHALQAWERQDLQQRAMIAYGTAMAGGRETSEMRVFPEFRR